MNPDPWELPDAAPCRPLVCARCRSLLLETEHPSAAVSREVSREVFRAALSRPAERLCVLCKTA